MAHQVDTQTGIEPLFIIIYILFVLLQNVKVMSENAFCRIYSQKRDLQCISESFVETHRIKLDPANVLL